MDPAVEPRDDKDGKLMNETTNHPNHFLDLRNIPARDLQHMVQAAKDLKWERQQGEKNHQLDGKTLVMIFEKNSTRTRMSFELAMAELGGYVMSFNADQLQLGRGETVADTARVISRYGHAIMLRANSHSTITELAEHASIPVINGLTDLCHPCQIMADILTIEEKLGGIEGKTLAWVGDGNNVANSFIAAAPKFGFTLQLACPNELKPDQEFLDYANHEGGKVMLCSSPGEAVAEADVVITDTWVSMGDNNAEERMKLLAPYQVNKELMALAKKEAIFLHCLPAHRGEEVTAEVIDGKQSAVWDEAENRLHVQKAVLLWCLGVL